MAGHEFLVKANSWIEGFTILAIISGMVIGAKVADYSTQWALTGSIILFLMSAVITLFLPNQIRAPAMNPMSESGSESKVLAFGKQMGQFFTTPSSRFAMLGGSLFWATAATLKVAIFAWAPLILLLENATEIAKLKLYLVVGIIIGSIIVPGLIPLEHLRRARIPACLMGILIIVLSLTDTIWPARTTLFFYRHDGVILHKGT